MTRRHYHRAGLTLIERCETHQGAQVSACLQCEVEALRRERADLLAALRRLMDGTTTLEDAADAAAQARAAITKAEDRQ